MFSLGPSKVFHRKTRPRSAVPDFSSARASSSSKSAPGRSRRSTLLQSVSQGRSVRSRNKIKNAEISIFISERLRDLFLLLLLLLLPESLEVISGNGISCSGIR